MMKHYWMSYSVFANGVMIGSGDTDFSYEYLGVDEIKESVQYVLDDSKRSCLAYGIDASNLNVQVHSITLLDY